MPKVLEGQLNAAGMRIAVITARFNDFITDRLLGGALDALIRHGAAEGDIVIYKVPGAFELPLTAKKLAGGGRFDGVVCLGAVIRGATPHFEYVASEAAKGIAVAAIETGVPISFGVITADNLEQAIERAGSKAGNKGWQAALSTIEMVDLMRQL